MIKRLPAHRWREFRTLRLKALRTDPSAYSGSYGEEKELRENEWKRRIKSSIFALPHDYDGPIGMIVCWFNSGLKSRHIAEIYGFYVSPEHRGRGIGTKLLERALAVARKNKRIIKVSLAVNPEQRDALRIYRKAGFVVTGRAEKELKVGRRFYGMVFMEKVLTP